MFKILFVYSDRLCTCTYKRSFEVVKGLWLYHRKDVDVQMIYFENLTAKTFYSFDVVIFQRLGANAGILTHEFRNHLEKWIEEHRHRCRFIYDIDDFLFTRQKSAPIWLAQLCHSALVPTDFLKKEMSRYQLTHIIRTHVDLEAIENAEVKELQSHNGRIKIGWFTTSANGIDLIHEAWKELKSLNEAIEIHLFCSSVYHEYVRTILNYPNLYLYPMVSPVEMYGYMKSMDCLINPLSPSSFLEATFSLPKEQFEKLLQSKAEIKYALAGAFRLPLIVSPNDAYKMAIQDNYNGYLASTAEEWIDKLRYLIAYPEEAKMVGKRAYNDVQTNYSLKRAAKDYLELARQV